MTNFDLKETERRMRGALTILKQEFGGLRTGRVASLTFSTWKICPR